MTDERVDLIITDGIATTITPKLREIVASATEAHTQLRLMQAAVNAIRDSSVKALAKEQTVLSQELSKQGVAHERLAAAAVRTETANARLLLVTGKVNTELERSALVQARVATETLRGEATMQRMTQATEKATDASRRRAAAVGAEGDAAVAAYRKQELAYFNAAQAANVQGGVRQFAGMDNLSGKSARSSASVFLEDAQAKEAAAKATEDLAVRSERLRSAVDPLYAAQVRYDRELAEATMLLRAGTISEETHAKAVMASAGALDAATIASKRHAAQTGLTKFQVLTLQYTINDVVASLASGASPMTILMQQGGQVTQAWGGLVPTLKAAGSALFTVYGAVGAGALGVGALALAYMKGAAEGEAYTKGLILTGNAAGLTSQQIGAMAEKVAASTRSTVGAASAALVTLTNSGRIPAAQFEMVAAAAVQMEKMTGTAAAETVKQFVELGKDPVKASIALNEQTHFLTASVWEQIKSLEEQGKLSAAGVVAQNAWADAIARRAPEVSSNLGLMESAWKTLGSAASKTWDAMLNVGRKTDPAEALTSALTAARQRVSQLQGLGEGKDTKIALASAEKEVRTLEDKAALLEHEKQTRELLAGMAADGAKQTEAQIAFDQLTGKHLQNESKLRDGIALAQERLAAAQKGASPEQQAANIEKYTQAVKNLQEAYKPKEAAKAKAEKLDPYEQFVNELKQAEQLAEREQELSAKSEQSDKVRLTSLYRVVDMYNLKKISVQQLLAAEELIEEVYQKQSGAEKSIAVGKEAVKVHNEYINSLKSSAKAIEDKEVALRDEVKAYDLSIAKNISLAEAVDLVAVSRLEEQRIVQMSFGDDAAVTQIEREIEARKRLADSIWQQDAHKKQIQSAKDVAAEWKKTAESVTNSLVDSFMQATDDGTTRFAKLRNDVEQMFKKMALNFVINAAVNTAGRTLGVSGSGSGTGTGTGTTGASSIFSALKGGYEEATGGSAWMTDFGGGVTSEMSKFGNMLSQSSNATVGAFGKDIISFANTPNLAENLTAVGKGLGYLNSAVLLSEGKYGSAAGAAIGTAFGGPIGGMLGQKLGSLFDSEMVSSRNTGDVVKTYGASGNLSSQRSTSVYSEQAGSYVDALQQAYADTAKALGASMVDTAFSFASNTGRQGVNPNFSVQSYAGGVRGYSTAATDQGLYGAESVAMTPENLQLEASRAVLSALKSSQLPKYLTGVFDELSVTETTQAQLDAVVAQAVAVKGFHDQLQLLPFAALKDLSYAASVSLEKAAGGLSNLGSGLAGYYDKFYRSEEKAAVLTKNTADAFATLGLKMPDVNDAMRDNYRALVENLAAQDLSVQANANAYIGALSLSQAVDQLAPAFAVAEDATASLAAAAAASAKIFANAMSSLAGTRASLEVDLLTAQGDPAGALALSRSQKLASLLEGVVGTSDTDKIKAAYAYNIALEDQITALNAARDAAEKAAQAQADSARAAEQAATQFRNAWQSLTDSIFNEVQRIRGLIGGNDAQAYEQAQARFTITTAQARSGDQEAAKLLPALSQTLLTVAAANAVTLVELRRIQGQTAASLTTTGGMLAQNYGLSIPSFAVGTNYIPYDMTARVHAGEEITPRSYVDVQRVARDETNALLQRLAEANDLNAEKLGKMREFLENIRDSNKRLRELAERDDAIGLPPTRAT